MPLVSIVIAVYNNKKYISKAINSVLQQSFDDYEIIIVDDGSTDGTSKIVDEIAEKNNKIRVIHQPNQWIYASFNNGAKVAVGEYVYILNSDDKLMNYALELLSDKVKQYNHPDVIYTKIVKEYVDEEQRVIAHEEVGNIRKELYFASREESVKNWDVIDKNALCDQANLYKRELMLAHPFENEYFCGDNIFNVDVMEDVKSFVVLPQVIYEHCIYNSPDMNISKGKYYDYTHTAYNTLYFRKKQFLKDNKILDDRNRNYIIRQRLQLLTHQMEMMEYEDCKLSIDDKLAKIIQEYTDDSIRIEAKECGLEREFESRILNGIKRMISNSNEDIGPRYEFIKELIHYLPDNHLENICLNNNDMQKIELAVGDKNNIHRLGDVYFHTKW